MQPKIQVNFDEMHAVNTDQKTIQANRNLLSIRVLHFKISFQS